MLALARPTYRAAADALVRPLASATASALLRTQPHVQSSAALTSRSHHYRKFTSTPYAMAPNDPYTAKAMADASPSEK